MARRSVESRCDRILNRLLPIGSFERRVHDLPHELKQALQTYEAKVSRIISAVIARGGEDAVFERLCSGDLTLPQMPADLRQALGLVDPPILTVDMTTDQCASIYRDFVGDSE